MITPVVRAPRRARAGDLRFLEAGNHRGTRRRADQVEVIYSASPRSAGIEPAAGRLRRAGSRRCRSPVVLYVGSLFNRRHIPELIDGFGLLAAPMPLSASSSSARTERGRTSTSQASSPAAAAQQRIQRAVLRAPTQSWPALYRSASAFIFLLGLRRIRHDTARSTRGRRPDRRARRGRCRARSTDRGNLRRARRSRALIDAALERAAVRSDAERARICSGRRLAILRRYSWRECAHRTLQTLLASAA